MGAGISYWLRKPRSVKYSQFLRMLPKGIGAYLQVEELSLRKERLQAMAHWCKVYALERNALSRCCLSNHQMLR